MRYVKIEPRSEAPATNDEHQECDIPVREGCVGDYRMKFIEERIECDEQGRQRRVVVFHLLKREIM
jgi:hypothetical protein